MSILCKNRNYSEVIYTYVKRVENVRAAFRELSKSIQQVSMKHKQGGLSLERFAKAKQSGYDKKAKKAKELALNAKKINKYRKLKQKLAATGLLAPRFTYEQQVR